MLAWSDHAWRGRCIEGIACPTPTWPTVSYSEDSGCMSLGQSRLEYFNHDQSRTFPGGLFVYLHSILETAFAFSLPQ